MALKVKKATFVAANTDRQALKEVNRRVIRFHFGENFTWGLGTGMNPGLGEQAALEERDKIKSLLKDQDLVILIATLGGGAGSGAAPIFAKISKNLGNLTYGIFTLPFKFEGEKKIEIAKESLEKLKNNLNGISVIPNDLIFQIIDKKTPLTKALSAINKNLADSLAGLIATLFQPGLINIDFADFKTIFSGRGRLTFLNIVEAGGEGRVEEIIKKLSFNPLCLYTIKGAKGILFNIIGGKNLNLGEVSQISKSIFESVNKEAKIVFGISQSQKDTDKIKVSLLANGCQTKIFPAKPKKPRKKIRAKKVKSKKKDHPQKPLEEENKTPKKIKQKPKKISVEVKKEETISPIEREKEAKNPPLPVVDELRSSPRFAAARVSEEKIEVRTRRNALQIKEELKEAEKEIIEKEEIWEPPAFLRIRPTRRPFNPPSWPKEERK
ncbi:MAG: hypothetical protein COV26_00275 [Candidatus Nealsonbacteria bacterium CG10_big_fil_rev_8_21_14_0_10_36_23]|uniref:Cell division protein FtsZ n=1 Tax=Candidatus Nealsonbacteria bacterium CG10_big_fil_rev_8_21_14_0_10_36_23 TaxID=1974709 RepID=A0A2H0TLU0_9BACT|nr:MAG: hypothetical protein COV26_00275 [Candidatus Nealsonbacteria bacterium CG10_big_fil_rev_8_21_14_0_10_36_23]